ncbi:interleukin-3-like [Callorhinus ursinus]|uniref:interleukin-3-like n=1 Tax=Callorhinus ursinus TaxID=34884 RepID=UPI003CD04C31
MKMRLPGRILVASQAEKERPGRVAGTESQLSRRQQDRILAGEGHKQAQWAYKRESRPGHSRCPTAREDPISSQKLKMCRSLCLQLLLIFLPRGLPRSVPLTSPGAQAQCCKYWSGISEICYKLNPSSTPEDINLRLELQNDSLLMSNLAAFRIISKEIVSGSNESLVVSKNLEELEKFLQTLPMPTPLSQGEVYIQAEDFNEFSGKLKVFLEALDEFLMHLLKCPETFKALCRKP